MKKNVVFWVGVKNEKYSENMVVGNGQIFLEKLGSIGVREMI